MDTPKKNLLIESTDQEHNPATNRFLNSLGFGETVLQDLSDSEQEGETPSFGNSENGESPAVMLSSQVDDLDLPGVDTFSEATQIRRGGLQDIVRRQSSSSSADMPIEKVTVSTSPGDELFSSEVIEDEPVAEEVIENEVISEEVEEEAKSTHPELTGCEEALSDEIPFPDAVLQRAPTRIISVIVNGREIKKTNATKTECVEKVIDEPEIEEEATVADIAVLSDERIEVGNEEFSGEEDFTDSESTEPIVLSCPKCDGELTLNREHLGVEGNCVWCDVSIVAAESGADGKIRVFAIESEKSSEVEVQQEEAEPKEVISNSLVAETEEQAPELSPLELPDLEMSPDEAPSEHLFENLDDLSPAQAFEKEPQPLPQIEDEKPVADSFSSLSEGTGFADLPSAPAPFEKEEQSATTLPEPLPELPSASTFDQLGKDAAWDEPFQESPQVDESELKKFPFLDAKNDSKVEATTSPEPKVSPSFCDPDLENKEESKVTETFPSRGDTKEVVEIPTESSPPSESSPDAEASASPFPAPDSTSEASKLTYAPKLKIPDDVLNFLGSIDSENEESPEEAKTDEVAEADEIESTLEPEAEPPVEEVAPLSKSEQKKERRAKKKEAALKKTTQQTGPLPVLGNASGKSGSKMSVKTKVGIISITCLVVGLGIASYLAPVQEYVDKARSLMSEAFNEQIGLDPNWKPPVVSEEDSNS